MHNKILGCLYGQALGDAFAMPAHVHPDDTLRAFGWPGWWKGHLPGWRGSLAAFILMSVPFWTNCSAIESMKPCGWSMSCC